jgi:hypothetical protein
MKASDHPDYCHLKFDWSVRRAPDPVCRGLRRSSSCMQQASSSDMSDSRMANHKPILHNKNFVMDAGGCAATGAVVTSLPSALRDERHVHARDHLL